MTLPLFAAAAVFEIAGGFAFWTYFRLGRPPWMLGLGVLTLVLFASALTRVDAALAGRAYVRGVRTGSTSLLHVCGSGLSKVSGLTDGTLTRATVDVVGALVIIFGRRG